MQTGHRRPPPSTLPPAGLKYTGHLTNAADCLRRDCEPRQPAATAYEEQCRGAARGGARSPPPVPRSGGAGSDGVGRCLQPGPTDPFLQELEEVQEATYRRCGRAGSCAHMPWAAAVPASQLDAPCAGWLLPAASTTVCGAGRWQWVQPPNPNYKCNRNPKPNPKPTPWFPVLVQEQAGAAGPAAVARHGAARGAGDHPGIWRGGAREGAGAEQPGGWVHSALLFPCGARCA